MAMMDSAEKQNLWGRIHYVVQHIPGGALLFAVVPLIILGYFGWFYYGADHLDQALYALRPEGMTVTPQPNWIKSNVSDEVFAHGRLDRISLLEPRANAAIAQAFETHNWVKSVTRVTKSAGGEVVVDLVYRRPAAMVYYEKETSSPESPDAPVLKGFFPIDEEGTVLPTQDFTSEDVWNHFMIIAENARPAGDVGMPYGDARVTEALALCAYLAPYREEYRLQEIEVSHDNVASGPSPWTLAVFTKDKREIVWGHAPRAESMGEQPAERKLTRVLAWLQEPPSSGDGAQKRLDVRRASAHASVSLPNR